MNYQGSARWIELRSDVDIADSMRASHCSLTPVVGAVHLFGSTKFRFGNYDMGYLGYQSFSRLTVRYSGLLQSPGPHGGRQTVEAKFYN